METITNNKKDERIPLIIRMVDKFYDWLEEIDYKLEKILRKYKIMKN